MLSLRKLLARSRGPRPDEAAPAAFRLYQRIVEQARQPIFYTQLAVPDTPDGRFDMVMVHAALVLRRLRQDRDATADAAQALFDLMFADMDQNLREMGVGDLAVGKRVKAMAQAFYGRLASYGSALDAGDDRQLADALRRNVYRHCEATAASVERLARYVAREAAALDEVPAAALIAGEVRFGAA